MAMYNNMREQYSKCGDGGAQGRQLIDGVVSAQWDKAGKLTDCCRVDGRGAIRKPNKETVAYLVKIGPEVVSRLYGFNVTAHRSGDPLARIAVYSRGDLIAEVNGMEAALAASRLFGGSDFHYSIV
jgi:hypothetical protein